jgi:transcriptional regulator with XRE-family HTH domain
MLQGRKRRKWRCGLYFIQYIEIMDSPIAATIDHALQDSFQPGGPPAVPQVGRAIRALRKARGMTLQALALASGVSAGMLSEIERDQANPSLRVLSQIRNALGAPISALFEEPAHPASDPAFVRRSAHRPWLELGYMSKELLSPGGPHNLQFMILHIPPLGDSGEKPLSYPAEKGGMLLEGALYLSVNGREVLLGVGDSFLFDSLDPHSFRNPLNQKARVLWIMGAVPVERHL